MLDLEYARSCIRTAENTNSRKLSFRYVRFSKIELPLSGVLGNSQGKQVGLLP